MCNHEHSEHSEQRWAWCLTVWIPVSIIRLDKQFFDDVRSDIFKANSPIFTNCHQYSHKVKINSGVHHHDSILNSGQVVTLKWMSITMNYQEVKQYNIMTKKPFRLNIITNRCLLLQIYIEKKSSSFWITPVFCEPGIIRYNITSLFYHNLYYSACH